MNKELKIEVPDGYEIDKENSTFERIVFKKKHTYLKSWKEFCEEIESVDKAKEIDLGATIKKSYNMLNNFAPE